MSKDNILDRIKKNETEQPSIDIPEDLIPRRCVECATASICSILPAFVQISNIGIKTEITKCPFYRQLDKNDIL